MDTTEIMKKYDERVGVYSESDEYKRYRRRFEADSATISNQISIVESKIAERSSSSCIVPDVDDISSRVHTYIFGTTQDVDALKTEKKLLVRKLAQLTCHFEGYTEYLANK